MVKYIIVSEVYATHDVVIRTSKPIRTFKTLSEARAYSVGKAPRRGGWWILKENERVTVIAGEVWTSTPDSKTVYLPHVKGDYGRKSYVNKDGTIRRLD